MFGGEDDDEETDVSATPYACMASLVTLQQMRNRLHLAYTGKKLMKWTALATGRELRKLAMEIQDSYKSFRNDMREGYILLARARYSNPTFNQMIMQNVGKKANIKVKPSSKSVSGVKTFKINIIDNDNDDYIHLGIGRGGETVLEAKEHWRELLKKVILMCQQRITFMTLELAHKSATRKKQLISKVVVPKLKATVCYILSELEEKEREDTFRLKRFKQLKTKKSEKNKNVATICAKCFCKYTTKNGKHDCPVCNPPPPKPPKEDIPVVNRFIQKKESPCVVCEETPSRKSSEPKIVPKSPSCKSCTGLVPPVPKRVSPTVCKVGSPCPSKTTSNDSINYDGKPCEKQPSSKSIPGDELGTFENKFKEIIKVTRHQNYDGTVCEEKQVITIRTERRSPRKPPFDYKNSECERSRGSHDYTSCCNIGARESKSEENRCKAQMGLKVRSCASNKIPVNRHRIPCSGSYNDLSMKSTSSRNSSYADMKNSSTMTAKYRERNRMPGSSVSSLSRSAGRSVTKTKSSCCGTSTCPQNLSKDKLAPVSCCGFKSKTVATNTATRDAATSTSNLGRKSSNSRKTSFLIGACTSCPSFSKQPRLIKFPASSKSYSHDEAETQKKIELNPKLIENLKNIFRTQTLAKMQKIVTDSKGSMETQDDEESAKTNGCQTDPESDEEIEITQCNSCGSITIRTCKSTSIETSSSSKSRKKERDMDTILTLKSKSIKSDADDDEDIRRDMAQTAKSFNSVCRSNKIQSDSCPGCPRDSCVSCIAHNLKYKDASTNTRRSARYDVRGVASVPIRLQAKKKSTTHLKSCSCGFDNTMMKDKEKVRPIRSPSILPDV